MPFALVALLLKNDSRQIQQFERLDAQTDVVERFEVRVPQLKTSKSTDPSQTEGSPEYRK